jgi:hypothetical protein
MSRTSDWRAHPTMRSSRRCASAVYFVTNNRDDFVELIEKVDLHAGLIVFMLQGRRDVQKTMFRAALPHVRKVGGLINRVLEVEQSCEIRVYELPTPSVSDDDAPDRTNYPKSG